MVFLEDHHLCFRLAERWMKRDRQLSAYRRRSPMIDDWVFTDGEGHPLEFTLVTYPHRLDAVTSIGVFSLVFADPESILITLPPGKCGVTFQANLDIATVDRRGGVMRLTGDIRRNIAYTTNARITANQIETIGPECQRVRLTMETGRGAELLLNITPRLGFNRYIPDRQTVLDAAARRWHDWFAAAPPVLEPLRAQYYFAWWVMRAGLISTRFFTTREAMTPSKMYYVGVWQWDAYFHALAYRHVDKRLAQDQLRILLDHQREDGMIPDAIHDEGHRHSPGFPGGRRRDQAAPAGLGGVEAVRKGWRPRIPQRNLRADRARQPAGGSNKTTGMATVCVNMGIPFPPAWMTARCGTKACRSNRLTSTLTWSSSKILWPKSPTKSARSRMHRCGPSGPPTWRSA